MGASKPKVKIQEKGPYIITGNVPLHEMIIGTDKEGFSEKWITGKEYPHGETYSLCRCGKSKNKPFCDGSHVKARFKAKETATRELFDEQANKIEGPKLELLDAPELCAFARFCDRGKDIWSYTRGSGNPEEKKLAIEEANNCPSGRLIAVEKKTGKRHEPKLEPSIGVVEDPQMECSGPLWVKGGIEIEGANGEPYETRNRVTLCRCGKSDNTPLCDGTHATR